MSLSADQNNFAYDWSLPANGADWRRKPIAPRPPGTMVNGSRFGGALYSDFLAHGLSHFFPAARIQSDGGTSAMHADLVCQCDVEQAGRDHVMIEWLGQGYTLRRQQHPFTEAERRLIRAIGRVLTARYQALFNPDIAAKNFHLFRGLPEDRYVSAFLDPAPYESLETLARTQDRVADAIEVLRSSALTTHENRRVSTGALLLDKGSLTPRPAGAGALRYSPALTSIRSFSRLCDGIHTVALVDAQGLWIDIVDVQQWSASAAGPAALPLPCPSAYKPHCQATLGNENLCLVLTPNGEIKVFARGVQVFSFLNGRWRLSDFERKYRGWAAAVGDEDLAKLVFQVALDLADSRRGGLFVILDHARSASALVSQDDLLPQAGLSPPVAQSADSKRSVYYLLNGRRTTDLRPAILRTLAAIDGGVVLDKEGTLLAFGAILKHHNEGVTSPGRLPQGGGRSAAALAASRYGRALKISEDGMISFFEKGNWVWDV